MDVSGCTQPTLVIASNAQGTPVAATLLASGYTGLAPGSTAQANVTPLTTAIVDILFGQPAQPLSQFPTLIGPASAGLTWTAEQQAVTALQSALSTAVAGYAPADPLAGGLNGAAGSQILSFRIVQTGAGITLQYQQPGGYAQTITLPAISNTPTSSPAPGSLSNASLYEGHSFAFVGVATVTTTTAPTSSAPSGLTTSSAVPVNCSGQVDFSGVVTGQCQIQAPNGTATASISGSLLNAASVPAVNTPMMSWQVQSSAGAWQPVFAPVSGNYAVVNAQGQGFSGQATFH